VLHPELQELRGNPMSCHGSQFRYTNGG
jgi:hypothetical protein